MSCVVPFPASTLSGSTPSQLAIRCSSAALFGGGYDVIRATAEWYASIAPGGGPRGLMLALKSIAPGGAAVDAVDGHGTSHVRIILKAANDANAIAAAILKIIRALAMSSIVTGHSESPSVACSIFSPS